MRVCLLSKNRLGLQAVTWDGERFALQITRRQEDVEGQADAAYVDQDDSNMMINTSMR